MAKSISRYLADISSTSGVLDGTLSTAAQTNITSLGTLSSLTVSGAMNGTLSTAAQPNITSVGTLTGLTVNGAAVFNENSADVDFRVESNNNSNMLFVDAGNDRVGIGTGTPAAAKFSNSATGVLNVSGTMPVVAVTESDVSDSEIFMGITGGTGYIGKAGAGNLIIQTGATTTATAITIDNSQNVTFASGLIAGGLTYPTSDGSNGQVLTTNGSGTLSFAAGGKTTEEIQDIVGAMFTGNTETRGSLTYQDGDGTIDLVVDDMTAVTTINNNANNKVITGSGTANTLEAEGNLTFDGTTLALAQAYLSHPTTYTYQTLKVQNDGGDQACIDLHRDNGTKVGTFYGNTSHEQGFLTSTYGWALKVDNSGNAFPVGYIGLGGTSSPANSCQLSHPNTSAWQTLEIRNNDDSTQCAIEMLSSQGTKRGIVYASSTGQGFLTPDAAWAMQITSNVLGSRLLLGGAAPGDGYYNTMVLKDTNSVGGISLYDGTGDGTYAYAWMSSGDSVKAQLYYNYSSLQLFLSNDEAGLTGFGNTNGSIYVDSSGLLTSGTVNSNTTSFTANVNISSSVFRRSTSARRYKENIQDGTKGLDYVMKLKPRTFNSKGGADGAHTFYGFIAEELADIGLAEFIVHEDHEDGSRTIEGIEYAHMVSLLTKAIQELKAQLDAK